MTGVTTDRPPGASVTQDAARLIRAVVVALPPETPRDRSVAARLEGAALALDVITAAS
jgi:hypothetical protein